MGVTILIAMGASFQKLRDRIDAQGKGDQRTDGTSAGANGETRRAPGGAARSDHRQARRVARSRTNETKIILGATIGTILTTAIRLAVLITTLLVNLGIRIEGLRADMRED